MAEWWLCPLRQCDHGAILHDGDGGSEDFTCCADGCDCRGRYVNQASIRADQLRPGHRVVLSQGERMVLRVHSGVLTNFGHDSIIVDLDDATGAAWSPHEQVTVR